MEREQSSLKTSVLLLMHQSGQEGKEKKKAGEGRGDAKLPFPLFFCRRRKSISRRRELVGSLV